MLMLPQLIETHNRYIETICLFCVLRDRSGKYVIFVFVFVLFLCVLVCVHVKTITINLQFVVPICISNRSFARFVRDK